MVRKRPHRERFQTGDVCFLIGFTSLLVSALGAGCGSIHTAADQGDVAGVKRQLAWGVRPDGKHLWTRRTPLIEAAANGHLDVVRLLVENGADVNLKGEAWEGPLHFAAERGHVEIVQFLLDHGADIWLFKPHNTPLHSAARGGQLEVARILLAHGADINWKGIDEATPLEVAVSHEQLDMVKLLLANGADVNSRGISGRTPLHVAAWKDNMAVGRILVEHGADPRLERNGCPVGPRSEEFRKPLEQRGSRRYRYGTAEQDTRAGREDSAAQFSVGWKGTL